MLRSSVEIAMALNLSGVPILSRLSARQLARLVVAGVRRYGIERVRELALINRMANLVDEDTAPSIRPEVLELQERIWTGGRQQTCTDATLVLTTAVERSRGLVVA
ncbi:hypothetical protein ABZX92_05785 [Lentzea sp. NPDC006480]|uniref:hypothetical protein n=1 Tax=Lentzea sp. NPDC006480 TaxID=3157176 RepID=UPI0033BB8813